MKCPTCSQQNPPEARYCMQCGAALERGCPACGQALPPDARFCMSCGRAVEPAARDEGAPGEVGRLPRDGERRQATILFSDLSGYTAMNERLDPEEVEEVTSRIKREAARIVESHGGVVNQFVGDEVMALFGIPFAHADDPLRAAKAALELHAMVRAVAPELDGRIGTPLRFHSGLNAGLVVTHYRDDRDGRIGLTGDPVNTAARLADRAGPDEILLGPDIATALAHTCTLEPLPAVRLKGKAEPTVPYRLGALVASSSEPLLPLAGRRAELGHLESVLATCRSKGQGLSVLVQGEAGIGKTRLVQELMRSAGRSGFACHRSLVLDFGEGTGRDAIRTLVRSLLGIGVEEADPNAMRAAAERRMDAGRQVFLWDLLGLPQPPELRTLYDAMDNATRNAGKLETLLELVRTVSREQPLLLVVEDLHWANPVTLGSLTALGEGVTGAPVVLVMTARPPEDFARLAVGLTLRLAPLREEEARALAGAFLGVDAATAQECVQRAEGNPLFLEQLLRSAPREHGADTLPGNVQSVVQARVDHLPAAERRAIQAAAVVGQRFSPELLRALLEQPDYDPAELLRQHLVVRDEGGFLFAHALVQEGVYQSTLKSRRRELHLRAAAFLAGRDKLLRADHLARAEDAEAPRAYLQAAREAALAYQFERASHAVQRGLELAREPADRFALTCLNGELLHDVGAIQESLETHGRALELAVDDPARCQAHLGVAAALRILDRHRDALAELERAEAAAGAAASPVQRAQLHYLRGSVLFPLGDGEGCLREHERALEHARQAGSLEYLARANSGLADAYYLRGQMRTALEHFRRCVEMSREHGMGRIEVANRPMCGWARVWLGEFDEALRDARAAAELAEKVSHGRAAMIAYGLWSSVLTECLGAHEAAAEPLARALTYAAGLNAKRFQGQFLKQRAIARHALGDAEGALQDCEEAIRLSRETGPQFGGPSSLVCRAGLAIDPEERTRWLDEADALLRQGAVSHEFYRFYRDSLPLCWELGDMARLSRHADELEAYTRAEPLAFSDHVIRVSRALVAWRGGDAGAAAVLRLLREQARQMGYAPGVALLDSVLANA